MLEHIDTGERSLEAYRGVALDPMLDELTRRARGLRPACVLHMNATPYGGSVSELRRSLVPLPHFLLPRLLHIEVIVMKALAAVRPIGVRDPSRTPVCGMAVAAPGIATSFNGRGHLSCSDTCRASFLELRRHTGRNDG